MADSSRRGFQGAGLFSKHTSSVFTFAKPLSILLLASGLLACGGGGGSSSGSIAACSGADYLPVAVAAAGAAAPAVSQPAQGRISPPRNMKRGIARS